MSAVAPRPTPTEAASRRPPRARRRPPSPLHVITATLGLFLVVLTLLALQVRSGRDPSLSARGDSGSPAPISAPAPASQPTRIVTRTS